MGSGSVQKKFIIAFNVLLKHWANIMGMKTVLKEVCPCVSEYIVILECSTDSMVNFLSLDLLYMC